MAVEASHGGGGVGVGVLGSATVSHYDTDDMLEAWVAHGSRLSLRTASVLSCLHAQHTEAEDALRRIQQEGSSLMRILGTTERSSTRITPAISRPRDIRIQIRSHRREFREALRRMEIAERQHQIRVAEIKRKELQKKAAAEAALAEAAKQKELQLLQERQREEADRERVANQKEKSESETGEKAAALALKVKTENQPGAVSYNVEDTRRSIAPAAPPQQTQSPLTPAAKAGASREIDWPPDVAKIRQQWEECGKIAEEFRKNAAMKKARLGLRKRINLAVNKSAGSVKQVKLSVGELSAILSDASALSGRSAEMFAMREIAERLVGEGGTTIALSRDSAFAISAVIVGIVAVAKDRDSMRNVIMGAFYNKCVYAAPAYIKRQPREDDEQFRERLGYLKGENGEGYMERMCGFICLLAAVFQTDFAITPGAFGTEVANPFSLDDAWRWLARIVNAKQRKITPALTFAFLEVAAYSMAQRYRKQFAKLLAMVQRAVVHGAVKGTPPGPRSRLESFIDEYIAAGCRIVNPPEGKKLPLSDANNM